LAKEVETSLRW